MIFRRLSFSISRRGVRHTVRKEERFASLLNHKNDFGIAAKWNFFANSPSDAMVTQQNGRQP
jgi:hypothetical protein